MLNILQHLEIWLYPSFKSTGGKVVNISAWYLKGTGFDSNYHRLQSSLTGGSALPRRGRRRLLSQAAVAGTTQHRRDPHPSEYG